MILGICSVGHTAVVTEAYTTPDDVTVSRLESNRVALTNGINSGDGSLIQTGTIPASALDANANPENRWNEGFNDFVFTGLTISTSATLSSTTASGIAYVNGTRVVKDSTAKTYTASRWTWVDLSSNGTFTYSETAIDGSEPAVATNSIRLARVSSDTTDIPSTTDERVTEINIAAGSAGSLADTDADTKIQTEESTDEDILRFDLGDDVLAAAREVLTIQAIDADDVKIEPTTDNDVDLGSATKEFKDLYIDGTAEIDQGNIDSLSLTSGATVTVILDEDDMATDSATSLSTQQSIKKYVDTTAGGRTLFVAGNTFTTSEDVTTVYLSMCAGGGGGEAGGEGDGGGGGGCIINYPFTTTALTDYVFTIGAGGDAGVFGGAAATDGADTVFDTGSVQLTVGKGTGGPAGVGGSGPDGSSTVGGFGIKGGDGQLGGGGIGGGGGGTVFGNGGVGGTASGGSAPTLGYGGGGGGADGNSNGGAGKVGVVIVVW